MTSNKKNIKQKALYGTLGASLLFSGFMVYTWDKVANDYNNLVDEYNKLKKTEGGTATTKWDSKNINKFLYHAEKMVNEAKNPLYDEMTADIILMEIKNASLEVLAVSLDEHAANPMNKAKQVSVVNSFLFIVCIPQRLKCKIHLNYHNKYNHNYFVVLCRNEKKTP